MRSLALVAVAITISFCVAAPASSEAGIKIIVSAFGSTETPTTSKENPTTVASQMASWVKQYGVDGIDVDWEVSRLLLARACG